MLIPLIALLALVSGASATFNMIVITDPSGKDPNGAAAASMSFAPNMFQSTFLVSKKLHVAVLAGGLSKGTARLEAILACIRALELGEDIESAVRAGISRSPTDRLLVGGPGKGVAVGGSYDIAVVIVKGNKIIIKQYHSSGGPNIVRIPKNVKCAVIHLRNTPGNPMYGTATKVRIEAAIMAGRMIRDGLPATEIVTRIMGYVAKKSGEKYGGGVVNITAGLSTGDTFVPPKLNARGIPMDTAYRKVCPKCGWSVAYPAASKYSRCPVCGSSLRTEYAWQVARDMITVRKDQPIVRVYGIKSVYDKVSIVETVQTLVQAGKKQPEDIARAIDSDIDNNTLLGYDYILPGDVKVEPEANLITIYMRPLPEGYKKPPLKTPISPETLHSLGLISSAVGVALIVLGGIRELVNRRLRAW
ncbi:hypothetical protein [Methanopyrus kandleri]|uniref:Uncharacterized protein n=1 Tax=Methanopyrus kandleri TaxID=2320 RepID=A0A832WAF3_9EURY|nr:hypothetical protein [Methanopyrus kandleri]HII70023.1 hypothetical protein [Methanopyrus kandleri]